MQNAGVGSSYVGLSMLYDNVRIDRVGEGHFWWTINWTFPPNIDSHLSVGQSAYQVHLYLGLQEVIYL